MRVETGAGAWRRHPLCSASQANVPQRPGIGKLFATFEEAWAYFLAREEPLESFHESLPEDPAASLDVWLVEPSADVKAAAAEVQRAFAHLDWIEPTPSHFLHVTLRRPLPEPPFDVVYRRVNCFHEAVIAEVESDALHGFLPHLTLGYVREPGPAADLRAAVEPLREKELGSQRVDGLLLVRVPASRSTVLRPWTVLERR